MGILHTVATSLRSDPETFLREFTLSSQKDLFEPTKGETVVDEIIAGGHKVRRFINEYWTSGQRKGHSLHEISYRGCFKAELPRFFTQLLSSEGELVFDPFMGRGTTLVEAALLGRKVAGNDVNPISEVLVSPRLAPPDLKSIIQRLDEIPLDKHAEAEVDLSMFYSRSTLNQICSLRDYLRTKKDNRQEDHIDRWIRMVATNRLTGHSPGFFSVYSLPPNQAVSGEAQSKINARRNQTPPDRNVNELIVKKTKRLLRDISAAQLQTLQSSAADAEFFCQDARGPHSLPDESVSLVVTSPPFLDTVQYSSDNWLRCWFNAIDATVIGSQITMARTVETWSKFITEVFTELKRVLRPGGWIAFEVGEIRGGKIRLDEHVAPIGIEHDLECLGIVINQQDFTKTSNCWGINNNSKGTNTNRIVLFRKSP